MFGNGYVRFIFCYCNLIDGESMKVAAYCRVSDDKLSDSGARIQDIQRQVDKLLLFAKNMGWEITEADIFKDDAISAYKDDYQSRPAFVRLLREIKGHHYQRVLVEDMTRWSRRLEDGLRTLRECAESGCTITSCQESDIDVSTSEGWAKSVMALFFAEWASRSMSDKVKSGMNRRRMNNILCESCQVVHLGRHPKTCRCKMCLKTNARKGRVNL